MSGIGEPPAGGVSTVRGMASRGFHSSMFTMTQTASLAPSGNASRGRSGMGEYAIRSVGSTIFSSECRENGPEREYPPAWRDRIFSARLFSAL
jgi:hypothetical protein